MPLSEHQSLEDKFMRNTKLNTRLYLTMIWLFLLSTLAVKASAQDSLVYSFMGGSDGANPYGVLVADTEGNLYGTTYSGGSSDAGTIFELVAASGYSHMVLYNFTGFGDGGYPLAGLIIDSSGNLYGTASCGGVSQCVDGSGGSGVVFRFSPSTGLYSVLYQFTGGRDGGNPSASLIFDSAMNLYGTTVNGGQGSCTAGCGVVFELTAPLYHLEDVLYRFRGSEVGDGANPKAPVIFNASQATLYGTTYQGGSVTSPCPAAGCGVAFQLTLSGTETVLHRFTGKSDGSLPEAPVIFDQTGTILYGTASAGDRINEAICPGGCGTVFRLSGPALKTFNTVHPFAGADGANPTGGLALDPKSPYSLAGTTFAGGADNFGVIFELEESASGTYTYTLIHSFTGAPDDGANPFAGLLLGIAPPDGVVTPLRTICPYLGCVGCSVGGGEFGFGSVFSN
jgi:uncharacterized repeat protein (TIGR03803 family)